MKQSWFIALLGAFLSVLFTSMTTFAQKPCNADFTVELSNFYGPRIQLDVRNVTGKKMYISVLKKELITGYYTMETELFTEVVPANVTTYSRILNLSDLESGSYRFFVKAGKRSFSRDLEIRAKPVRKHKPVQVVVLQQV